MTSRLLTGLALTTAAALPVALAPALAAPHVAQAPTEWSDAQLRKSIIQLEPAVTQLEDSVEPLDDHTTDGAEEVISLDTDVLFAYGKADLPATFADRAAELVIDVPKGATVEVGGHTDSIGADDFNQKLSERRADAVAKALKAARPDLSLEVEGYGEKQPVAPNESAGKDDPEGRAKNRRVEIRYGH